MNDNITTELLDCYMNRRIFSMNCIKYFIFYFASMMDLEEGVKLVKFPYNCGYGSYTRKHKLVNIGYKTILEKELEKMNTTIEQATKTQLYIINLKILEVIFHELGHAEQYMQSKEIHVCSAIIKKSLEIDDKISVYRSHLYSDSSDDFISEYNAKFMAQVQLHDLLQQEALLPLQYIFNADSSMFDFLCKNFFHGKTPFERFQGLDDFFGSELVFNQKEYNDLSEYEKLSYGITVNDETIKKIKCLIIRKPSSYIQYFS